MSDNEIDALKERLRHLKPKELLEIIQKLSRSETLTDERRKALQEVALTLIEEIRANEEVAKRILKEKSREILELISQLRDDDTLPENLRQQFDTTAAMIAGYLMHAWLPTTLIRKILMFLFFIIGIIGIVKWSLWFGLFIVFGAAFSPRIVGEVAYLFGSLRRNQRK
jgi:hypothetical protein